MAKRFSVALGESVKYTLAISLISYGISLINQGDILIGGALVAAGWLLIVINQYVIGG